MSAAIAPFHLAIPVRDLTSTRAFYGDILGCSEGRSASKWIDWNFFGHQLSTHLRPNEHYEASTEGVDGKQIPCRHFGIVLPWEEWHSLKKRLVEISETNFIIEPYIRFEGQVGEQATMFFLDPSGNALEFKSLRDPDTLFMAE